MAELGRGKRDGLIERHGRALIPFDLEGLITHCGANLSEHVLKGTLQHGRDRLAGTCVQLVGRGEELCGLSEMAQLGV